MRRTISQEPSVPPHTAGIMDRRFFLQHSVASDDAINVQSTDMNDVNPDNPLPLARYKKGSHPKGRNVFLKDAEPFIKWLEEAEEEEAEEA